MTAYTLISGDEAKLLVDIQRRILGVDPEPLDWSKIKSPFCADDWKILAVSGHFHDSTDTGQTGGGWPRRDGMDDIDSYLDPLFWHLRAMGRDHVIVSMNWEPWPQVFDPHGPALYCRCPLDADVIYDACYALSDELRKIGAFTTMCKVMAFDTHGDWATADTEEEAHLLGGTPEFIDGYCQAAGGEDYVRAWFYHWDIKGPITYFWNPPPPAEWQKKFYDFLGWPPAPYLKGRTGSSPDIDWSLTFGDRIKSCGPGE